VVGTPYYLAPEQARGQKATPLCDIYAAGVTLYYLLTGKRPFVGATALAVLNKHIHEPPVPPMKHRAEIPKPLNDIVLKMMAKKPSERYQSAAAAAADLELFLKGKPVQVDIPFQLPFALPPALAALTKKQQIVAASSAGGGLLLLIVLLVVAFSGGKPEPTTAPVAGPVAPAPAPVTESPESIKLKNCLDMAKHNRENMAAYADVLEAFDIFIITTPTKDFQERGKKERQVFVDFLTARAEQELDRRLKETNPYLKLQALRDFPVPLVESTGIDKKLRDELAYAHRDSETRYLKDEREIDKTLEDNRYSEAGAMLEALLPYATGTRKDRLLKIKGELPQRAKDYDDETLRRLNATFVTTHASFEEALIKRETGTAFSRVTKFVREMPSEAERQRMRVQNFFYDPLLKPFPDPVLNDSQLLARVTVDGVLARAQNTLPFRILSDLQDAMDVEFIVREATLGLDSLTRSNGEVRLETFNATGRVTIDAAGYRFLPKAGVPKPINNYRQLQPVDIFQLAALAEGSTVEQLFETNDHYSRSMGAVWVYSASPERWAQAGRCFARAKALGLPGLDFRIDDFRERGYREVRDRIEESRKELALKNFAGAKQPLAGVENAWKHDPVLAGEIGRAMATVLVSEVLFHERNRDFAKLKAAARTLRTKYDKLYPEEVIFAPYANAMRATGQWSPAASLLNSEWTWAGKEQNAPCPADDETRSSRGLKLKSEKSIRLARSKGVNGAIISLLPFGSPQVFSTGFRFDASDKDGLYKKLVVRDTGEVHLLRFDGKEEIRETKGSVGRKLVPGQWIELSFVAEAGDIVAYIEGRPVLLWAVPVATDRDFELWTSVDANFRGLQVRR